MGQPGHWAKRIWQIIEWLSNGCTCIYSIPITWISVSQVLLYSGEPLSHHSHITCAKSYSILFKWSSASVFSNAIPQWRHESLDVFRILCDPEILTMSCRGGFEETKASQKCSQICIYCRQKRPITWSCILEQLLFWCNDTVIASLLPVEAWQWKP